MDDYLPLVGEEMRRQLTGTFYVETRYINNAMVKNGVVELVDGDAGHNQAVLWFEYEDGTQTKRYRYDYAPQWLKNLYHNQG